MPLDSQAIRFAMEKLPRTRCTGPIDGLLNPEMGAAPTGTPGIAGNSMLIALASRSPSARSGSRPRSN
jgi:hypothetical protein